MSSGVSFASVTLREVFSSLSSDRLREIEETCQEEAVESPELKNFFCPITGGLMWWPVILNCQHSFDLEAIRCRLQTYSNTCPLDKENVSSKKTNDVLIKKIKEYVLGKLTDAEKSKLLPTQEKIEKDRALRLFASSRGLALYILQDSADHIHTEKIMRNGIPYIRYTGPYFTERSIREYWCRDDGYLDCYWHVTDF